MNPRRALLLVEDSPDDALVFLRQVEALGEFDVYVAGDGAGALRYLEALHASGVPLPVAVFVDLRLSGMSGLELMVELAKRERFARIPCFLLSEATPGREAETDLTGGTSPVFEKPISATSLALALANY